MQHDVNIMQQGMLLQLEVTSNTQFMQPFHSVEGCHTATGRLSWTVYNELDCLQ